MGAHRLSNTLTDVREALLIKCRYLATSQELRSATLLDEQVQYGNIADRFGRRVVAHDYRRVSRQNRL